MIIGFCGFLGSGKDTAAEFLVNNYNFERDSFAKSLKDVLSVTFGWDRDWIEGKTPESRAWREEVDSWWAHRLNIPNFTPRFAMQHIGTDVFRNHFNNEIWVATLENRLRKSNKNYVVSDVRFPNEIEVIKKLGGKIVRVIRGPDPEWIDIARSANLGNSVAQLKMKELNIHPSEWAWLTNLIDIEIENNLSLENLFSEIKSQVLNLPVATEV